MNKILVIVESPSKCKKIESYLGSNYKCVACYGHLREIKGLNCIDILNNFIPTYSVIDNSIKIKQIQILQNEINKANEVILATDDDREGEAIAWHICQIFNLSVEKTKRIIFHEITENAIQQAILYPKNIDMNIVYAQQGRQILDLLVGFTITPILWDYISKGHKNSLSAGRCQTPALRIVYDNYIEIKESLKTQIYNTIGYFTSHNIPFELSKQIEDENTMVDFLENTVNFEHFITVTPPKQSFISQPQPLITSSLQQLSSNELHWSPKETMKYAQQLYENGLITYMRTDSKTYNKEFIEHSKKYILQNYNDSKYILHNIDDLSMPVLKQNTIHSQEAHEAIRPISLSVKIEDINNADIDAKAKKLYNLIWRRTLESCMSPCITYYINAQIPAYSNLIFKHKSEEIFFYGWKIVSSNKNKEQNKIYNYLLALKQQNKVQYNKITSNIVMKNTKLHLTEAMLVHLLEEKGIGRPSTYSSLVDKIQERGYVVKENISGQFIKCTDFTLEKDELTELSSSREFGAEKNKLVIQPLGILVIEFLINHFNPLFNYEYTKKMEDDLDIVSKGECKYNSICSSCYKELNLLVNTTSKEKYNIKIDENHYYIIGKYGPVIKQIRDNVISFLSVKKDIDMDKLKRGLYSLSDLLEDTLENDKNKTSSNISSSNSIILGKYQGHDLYLKNGKYGVYVQWANNKVSLKDLSKTPFDKITLIDVLKYLEKDDTLNPNKPPGLVRNISQNISIRSGQYGDYILYKTSKMKKPQFFKLKDFKGDYIKCNDTIITKWLKEQYNIE
jgi:DNA topoisomerase-1